MPDMDGIGYIFEDNAFQFQFWIVPLSLNPVLRNASSMKSRVIGLVSDDLVHTALYTSFVSIAGYASEPDLQ